MNLPLTPLRFLERAKTLYGKKEGIICGAERFTYAAFFERCCRLAGALAAAGHQPGDRVAFLSYNCHRLLEGYYGVLLAHGVLLPLNIRLSPAEIAFILRNAGVRIVFLDKDFLPLLQAIQPHLPAGLRLFLLEPAASAPHGIEPASYDQLLADASPAPFDFSRVEDDSLAELFYTSGTSGDPKGVMLSHRTVYLHALNTLCTQHLTDRSAYLHTIPLFHANGWGTAHTVTAAGGTHVMLKKFDPERICQLVEQERVTFFSMVPTMATALIHCPALSRTNRKSLEWVMVGGAAASPELIRQLEEKLGCRAYVGYGLTETSPVLSIAFLTDSLQNAGQEEKWRRQAMTGRAVVGVELRVVDDKGNDVPRDGQSIGEIIARSDGVMDGYWQQPEDTQAALRDGWLWTGDMAVWDEEGYVLIVDRKKEIIVSGGENISSLEIERALSAHPGVYECAVIAVPDDKWGEVPKALVVCKENAAATAEDMLAFLRERIAKFKVPKSVEFLPSLPKGGTGKILKKQLREKYWAGYAKRVH
jgi:fatty-acyl-CoA synthase